MTKRLKELLELEQAEKLIRFTVESWKLQDDQAGCDYFFRSLEQLERLADTGVPGQRKTARNELYSQLEALHRNVLKKDLAAVTDVLEYGFLPLLSRWKKDVNEHDCDERQ
ncbi:hypothetical protein SAMN05421736_101593 [Evansella caseinilytica]|uniref:Uncharacterized protein n=1 Tax=Evansella caseinilytica TaxID=1503961 RepID=A0A1H3HSE1_9BACI|nr:hypothetical protein [Evansella caseinilytica]SDY18145.1 hypothetical protein SAMN05421736_101593 [Evansella caseinilytica]